MYAREKKNVVETCDTPTPIILSFRRYARTIGKQRLYVRRNMYVWERMYVQGVSESSPRGVVIFFAGGVRFFGTE